MRRFLMSFLGALTAFWLTIILLGLATLAGVAVLIAASSSGGSAKIDDRSVLHLNLNMTVSEGVQSPDIRSQLLNGSSITTPTCLSDIVGAIEAAADDKRIDGIFIDCNGISAGQAQIEAIGEALARFKESGKWVWAYGDNIDQADYLIACQADSIFVNPSGSISVNGITVFNPSYKRLLDKLGVKMQVVKVGTYKSAVEPYILDGPSEANIEQERLFINNLWASMRDRIARGRHVPADSVDAWVTAMCDTRPTAWYLQNHMADAAIYRHEMTQRLKEATGRDADADKLPLVSLENYLMAAELPHSKKGKATIAVYYAEGDIIDGDKAKGTVIAGDRMVAHLDGLAREARDGDIDALVIRVNSPGGSAFASEQIWEAVRLFKEKTGLPVYVSMGDYAASGGYYISCGADKIFAQPTTLTGSIGIFGLIPDASGLLDGKLGVGMTPVSTHPGIAPITPFAPMSEQQRAAMQTFVDNGYELFVKRVADGRKMSVEQVKAIAEGRVWDGKEALARGLVDELGGLDAALDAMAKELNVETWEMAEYPDNDNSLLKSVLAELGYDAAEAVMPDVAADYGPEMAEMLEAARLMREGGGVRAWQRPLLAR